MHLNLITPDKLVFEGQVDRVTVPGSMGSFTILENHAAIISSLSNGNVSILTAEDGKAIFNDETGKISRGTNKDIEMNFKIDGGVVEVLNNKIIVLAEALV